MYQMSCVWSHMLGSNIYPYIKLIYYKEQITRILKHELYEAVSSKWFPAYRITGNLINAFNPLSRIESYHEVFTKRLNPVLKEGPEGRVLIPFPTWHFSKILVPVRVLLEIPVRVIKISVNKIYICWTNRFIPPFVAVCSPCGRSA